MLVLIPRRGGTLDPTYVPGLGTNPNGLLVGPINDKDAWYFGAGFDFSLDDNLWGLMDGTEVLAELGVNYTELATNQNNGLSPPAVTTFSSCYRWSLSIYHAANTQISNCQYGDCIGFSKNKILERQCI